MTEAFKLNLAPSFFEIHMPNNYLLNPQHLCLAQSKLIS